MRGIRTCSISLGPYVRAKMRRKGRARFWRSASRLGAANEFSLAAVMRFAQSDRAVQQRARNVQRPRDIRVWVQTRIDVRVQRKSLALMDFVVERQRTEHPQDSIERPRKFPQLMGVEIRQQAEMLRH